MSIVTLAEMKEELESALNSLLNTAHTSVLEANAQKLVNDLFKRYKARDKHVVLSGVEIIGCTLAFEPGKILCKKLYTAFYPADPFDVKKTNPTAIPLGYVNGEQLYFLPESTKLISRYGWGPNYRVWTVLLNGVPTESPNLYVAYRRAVELGHLDPDNV